MAATGFTPISLYYSTTASAVPLAANLANGELALNTADMKLYSKNSAGVVTLLASSGGAAGTVSSVAQSFTGGLISVSGSPITTSGTLALTVAGTSGGIPYFSSASTWATSAALAASSLVVGGGAGAAPSTVTTGTGVVTALGVNTGSAGAFVVNGGALGTPSSGTVTNLTGTASININGTVGATTPTTGAFTTLSASSSVTLSGGTANGVTYLNGSKVLTSGSALTFDGTTLTNNNSGQGFLQTNTSASTYASFKGNTGGTTIWTGIGTDTGISWLGSVSNHDVVFRQNNTEGMRLTSTGLGIGTSSPSTKLTIGNGGTGGVASGGLGVFLSRGGTTNFYEAFDGTKAFIAGSDDAQSYTKVGSLSNHPVRLVADNGTGYVHLTTAGNLGLGVTPSAWSGYTALQVNNAISLWTSAGSSVYLSNNVYTDGVGRKYVFNGYASEYQSGSGAHYWKTAASGTAGNAISFTQAMTLSAAGYLGIGDTAPTAILSMFSSNQPAHKYTGAASGFAWGQYNSSGDASLNNTANANLTFNTNNTERARISSTGGFSVGTTANPGAGAIYATGAITAFYSDARLKTVSGKIEDALDKVSKLSGVYYTNNDTAKSFGYTSDEVQVGVLAQEIEAVLPQVVKAAPFDLDENGNSKSGQNYKTVQYEKLVPLLIEAINELRAEVTALKGTI